MQLLTKGCMLTGLLAIMVLSPANLQKIAKPFFAYARVSTVRAAAPDRVLGPQAGESCTSRIEGTSGH